MKFSFYLLFIFSSFCPLAQSELVISGAGYKTQKDLAPALILGHADGYYFILRRYQYENYLESYDENTLTKVSSVLLNTRFENRTIQPLTGFIFEGKPTLLFVSTNYALTEIHYFIQTFQVNDLSGLKLVEINTRPYKGSEPKNWKNLYAITHFYSNEFMPFGNHKHHEFYLGINKSIQDLTESSELKKPKIEYEITRMDSAFQVVSVSTVKIPFNNFTQSQYEFSENKKLFFIGSKDSVFGTGIFETVIPASYHIFSHDLISGETKQAEFGIEGHKIEQVRFKILEDDGVLIAGFLSTNETGAMKYFSITFSPDLKEIDHHAFSFEDEFRISTAAKGESADLYGFKIRELLSTSDDGIVLFAEQWKSSTFSPGSAQENMGSKTTFRRGNVIVIKFSKSGNAEWKTIVKKEQVGGPSEYNFFSFYTFSSGNEVSLVFNENKENLIENFTTTSTETESNKEFVSMVILDSLGQLKEKKMLGITKENSLVKIEPGSCKILDEHNLLLYMRKGSKVGLTRGVME